MYFENLDNEITLYLRKTGKTQAQLAEEVGMTDNTFSWKRRGVRGKEFTIGEVRRVADAIGLESFDGILDDFANALGTVA